MRLQKSGGVAVLASICVYIVFMLSVMPIFPSVNLKDPAEVMAVMSSNASGRFYVLLLLWLVYILLSFFVIVALHERMHSHASYLSHMMLMAALASAAIALTSIMVDINSIETIVPTQDLSAFRAYWNFRQGLKEASDFAFGWSFLFAGCAILVTRSFSRVLGWLATATGILLIPVCFPVDFGLKPIYAILLIFMYLTASIWLGIALLQKAKGSGPG